MTCGKKHGCVCGKECTCGTQCSCGTECKCPGIARLHTASNNDKRNQSRSGCDCTHKHFHAHAFALAAATAMSIAWSLSTLLLAFMPELAEKFMVHTTHIAGEQFHAITAKSFIVGFVSIWLSTFIIASLFAYIYNKLNK